jgi:putative restriction endonuclease
VKRERKKLRELARDRLERIASMPDRDEEVRVRCFLALDALRARHGNDLPFVGALSDGFVFAGKRVPFLNRQKGIYRSAIQNGPAALSIQTSFRGGPYDDVETDDGFLYSYREGSVDQADNRALRQAYVLRVPIAYFVSTRPGWYRVEYPCFITADDPRSRRVLVTPGRMTGTLENPEPTPIEISVERKYAVRETRVRLHQGQFRALVLQAYRDRCTICRLRELRLLDAAHIVQDVDPRGLAEIPNGLSLCSIHHRAYDQDLVGVSPDYEVHVSPRLLDEQDGPMLDVLKRASGRTIELPRKTAWHPDRERLATRFQRFATAG